MMLLEKYLRSMYIGTEKKAHLLGREMVVPIGRSEEPERWHLIVSAARSIILSFSAILLGIR